MRFSGAVGYASTQSTAPGVWKEIMAEKTYYGDVLENSRRLEPPSTVPPEVNGGISLTNSFSIMADADAYANFMNMRYVLWEGQYWTVTDVQVRRPRLILTVGGLWNGDKA